MLCAAQDNGISDWSGVAAVLCGQKGMAEAVTELLTSKGVRACWLLAGQTHQCAAAVSTEGSGARRRPCMEVHQGAEHALGIAHKQTLPRPCCRSPRRRF